MHSTLAQKKDPELRIIEGLHNHNSGHEINNIYPKHSDKPINIGPCHACNGPHLIKDCNEPKCGRCKLNLDNHTPYKFPRKYPFNKQQSPSHIHNNDKSNRNKINHHTEPNVQLSISTNKPDHMAELLEATRKMTKYFRRSYKHSKTHSSDNSMHHSSMNHYSNSHPYKHKCKSHNNDDKANKIINQNHTSNHTPSAHENNENTMTLTVLIAYSIPPWIQNDYPRKMKLSKLNKVI